MANNPVQVVLQTDQYMKLPEGGGGGGAKDFFKDRDDEFVRHKPVSYTHLDVYKRQGHASLATTTVYVTTETRRRMKAVESFWKR